MKKKILIVGPIGDYGGRDVEVNIIAKVLEENHHVHILSTACMTEDSFSLLGLNKTSWESVHKELYLRNFFIRQFSSFSKLINRGSCKTYSYVNNRFSKSLLNFDQLQWEIIQKELIKADIVLLCVQLTTKFFPEIVQFCYDNKIPSLVRTTGTIRNVPQKDFDFLRKVTQFIHHSESNASNLNKQIRLPYTVIDQCALFENELLQVPIQPKKPYRFGYLGRLSTEKGILPTAQFFAQNDYPFVIAGDGPQKEAVLATITDANHCVYLGLIQNHELTTFFEQIDVLVIPSFEESGPLVGLEAMAAGKLILSTKVGAMEERLNGLPVFWFDISDLRTLENNIQKLNMLSLDNFKTTATVLRNRYLDEYGLDTIAKKYNTLIQIIFT